MLRSMKPVTIDRVMLKEGGINYLIVQVSGLWWSFLLYCMWQLIFHDRESHPTALNASVKKQEL